MTPRELLLASFRAALTAADPLQIVPRHLPPPPPASGRTIVVGAGKAAAAMAKAGADIIVCHFGLTTGGSIGSKTSLKLEDCPALFEAWADAALKVNKNAIIIAHGGPVSSPEDASYILKHTKNCHGFYGASSMERLPTEIALTEQTRKFKAITF